MFHWAKLLTIRKGGNTHMMVLATMRLDCRPRKQARAAVAQLLDGGGRPVRAWAAARVPVPGA
eukprot:scaffold600_cov385-Prasinococcus_capsulatus_cf.AAC.18